MKKPEQPKTRREFLEYLFKAGAGALAVAMGTGGAMKILSLPTARAAAPSKRKFRYGMVIDPQRCVGCKACVVACKAENKTPPGLNYNEVMDAALEQKDLNDKPFFMTRPCYHCENPPCVDVCTVKATFKRKEDGLVVVDYDRCIKLGYCIAACPYGARQFDLGENSPAVEEKTPYAQVPSPEYKQFFVREKGKSPIQKVRKCTFCLHLQDRNGKYNRAEGRWPACAKTCTGHAIHFGDLNDPQSEVSKLLRERKNFRFKEEQGTEPNVYYLL